MNKMTGGFPSPNHILVCGKVRPTVTSCTTLSILNPFI